jgi:hypothetical protein
MYFIYEGYNFCNAFHEIKNNEVILKNPNFNLKKKTKKNIVTIYLVTKIISTQGMCINLKKKALPGSEFNGREVTFSYINGFIFHLENPASDVHPSSS